MREPLAVVTRCYCGTGIIYTSSGVADQAERMSKSLEKDLAEGKLLSSFYNPKLNQLRGKLIVFEGHDLTGKTTVSKLLRERLIQSGISTVWTFQPGDPAYGEHASTIRSFCKDKKYDMHPLANYLIFLADKVEVCSKVILPALKAGKTVITDRWSYSTVAYQIAGKELWTTLPGDVWKTLDRETVLGLVPHFTFYFPQKLNVDRERDAGDQWETAGDDFSKRVQASYDQQARELNWTKVVPEASAEETLESLIKSLP